MMVRSLNHVSIITPEQIRQQVIWCNEHIIFGGNTLFFNSWIMSNVLFVDDLIDKQGNIRHELIIHRLKGRSNWINEMFMLINALPTSWRDALKEAVIEDLELPPILVKLKGSALCKSIDMVTTKEYYWSIVSTKFVKPWITGKWETLLNCPCNWSQIWYNRTLSLTQERHLSNFRYKFLHDILPNGVNLYKWQVATNNRCEICDTKNDICHMFIDCKRVKPLWHKVELLLTNKLNYHVQVSLRTLVCGLNTHNKRVNLLIIIAMYTIYKSWLLYKDTSKLKTVCLLKMLNTEVKKRMDNE